MAKALPCSRCGTAKILEHGKRVDYTIGKLPSSFRGAAVHNFSYRCACLSKLAKSYTLTLAQWHALPDIPVEPDLPPAA